MKHVELHHRAMGEFENYHVLRQTNWGDARAALRSALSLETLAARAVPLDLEPTRSVYFRSAASLAILAKVSADARQLVSEALRGNPPAEIKAELLDLLATDFGDRRSSPPKGKVLQTLYMKRLHPTKNGELQTELVNEVTSCWIDTYTEHYGSTVNAVQVGSGSGSFLLDIELKVPVSKLKKAAKAIERIQERMNQLGSMDLEAVTKSQTLKEFEGARSMLRLLSKLTEGGMELSVEHVYPDGQNVNVQLLPLPQNMLPGMRRFGALAVSSLDIPQANDLDRVFRFIDFAMAESLPTPADLGVTTSRQVAYYRQAAEILGFFRDGLLTPAGELLKNGTHEQRIERAAMHFETSMVGSAWLGWGNVRSVDLLDASSAERFLLETSLGLSPKTTKRRSKTLKAWCEVFQRNDHS